MTTTNLRFQFFTRLPTELRLQIWRLACQPRVVEIRYNGETDLCSTSSRPPALLHVCTESRAEGRRIYHRAFVTRHHPAYIYFSPDLDVLYLPRHGQMGYDDAARDFGQYVLGTPDLVRYLAIDYVQTDVIRPWEPYNKFCLLQSFPLLTSAFIVFLSSDDAADTAAGRKLSSSEEIEFIDPPGDPAVVVQLMDGILESFCYEVGPVSSFSEKEEDFWFALPLPCLIPKSKVLPHPLCSLPAP